MKIEVLLLALVFSFSQASFSVNDLTIYPLGHPSNGKVPVDPTDPVKLYDFEHTTMMFFSVFQKYFIVEQSNEDFLDCLEVNIGLYTNFSNSFTKNITEVGRSIKNSLVTKKKPIRRAVDSLTEIAIYSKEFGQKVELAVVEENSELARNLIREYKIKIKESEHKLLKALNKLAKTYPKQIEEVDNRLKKISLQTQTEANQFIKNIQQCMRK